MMMKFKSFWFFGLALICQAGAQINDVTVGNVASTSFAVCWRTGEDSVPDVQVFSDAAGTTEITSSVKIERQILTSEPRSINGGTPISRAKNRGVQAAMTARRAFLVRISGVEPDQEYWVRAVARDSGGNVLHQSELLALTTAARAEFIKEARQLVVDLSAGALAAGDLSGLIVRLRNDTSPYPLFSVVNDGHSGQLAYFDLTHFLDAAGETQLVLNSGATLDLMLSFVGGNLTGTFSGNEVASNGEFVSTRTSLVGFAPEDTVVNLNAVATRPTALSGHPMNVNLTATDAGGQPLLTFNRSLTLTSPALAGGTLSSEALENGVFNGQPVILAVLGNQTVVVTDPESGATTDFTVNVLEYSYENYRLHYFGDLTSPEGELTSNNDGDEFENFDEFTFGLDPTVNEGPVAYEIGGGLLKRGGPDVVLRVDSNGVDLRVTFLRLKNHEALGIQYTPELSANMSSWFGVLTPPVVIAEEGEVELVSVPYPYFTSEPRKARFFRLRVSIP